jgi:Mg-chelatase subunit ChlD
MNAVGARATPIAAEEPAMPRMLIATLIALAALLAAAVTAAPPAHADEAEVLLILDCSGSMTDPMEGRTRIDIAKDSLYALVDSIPDGTRVGLRAYSHRYDQKEKSCKDTEALVAIGPIQKGAIKDKVRALRCVGWTPIAFSLEASIADFHGKGGRTIVLLSDGKETCGGDPVATARRLKESGVGITTHVIGFGVDAETRAQLEEIAKSGGGRYWDAKGAQELAKGLEEAVKESIPEFTAKEGMVFDRWYSAMGVEVLAEKGEMLDLKTLDGKIFSLPRYLFFVGKKRDAAAVKVGDQVLAAIALVNGRPHHLHLGRVVESKKDQFRVATKYEGEIWVPAGEVYEPPHLHEGKVVKLASVKASQERDHPAARMLEGDLETEDQGYWNSPRFPVDLTFRIANGPHEIRRIGILPNGYSRQSAGEAAPAAAELYVGASGPEGFQWKAIGLLKEPRNSGWHFFRFPAVTAEYVHLRVLKSHGEYLGILRLRVYADDGPGTLPLEEIVEPNPPVGAAGELEKKAQTILVEEPEGAGYREVKVLKKTEDKVIAITGEGKKINVEAAKTHPLEPIDIAKLELGDDVLMPDPRVKDLFVRATVIEMGAKEVKVQRGEKEYKAKPENLLKAPPQKE